MWFGNLINILWDQGEELTCSKLNFYSYNIVYFIYLFILISKKNLYK